MNRMKICVTTGTRAEYHLLYSLLKVLQEDEEVELTVAVTGAHLDPRYGSTYKDILQDGFEIACKIPVLQEKDDGNGINQAISLGIQGFSSFFAESRPDLLVLLGDRYEMLAAAVAAMNYRIPIAHIHGGEKTEGAIDESIRHALTKMSYLHFTSCEEYRKRVIQLGENPDRVFNVGSPGVENIRKQKLMTRSELEENLHIQLDQYMLVTYHPVTLENNTAGKQVRELLKALDAFEDMKIVFTKANADSGGIEINQIIDDYALERSENCIAVYSLGALRYLSAMKYAAVVVGNSSSGILETPSFGVPTVNIGDRQKGRIQAQNIINCGPLAEEIISAIRKAREPAFTEYAKKAVNPYEGGNTSEKIAAKIKEFLKEGKIMLKKEFYDIV